MIGYDLPSLLNLVLIMIKILRLDANRMSLHEIKLLRDLLIVSILALH